MPENMKMKQTDNFMAFFATNIHWKKPSKYFFSEEMGNKEKNKSVICDRTTRFRNFKNMFQAELTFHNMYDIWMTIVSCHIWLLAFSRALQQRVVVAAKEEFQVLD